MKQIILLTVILAGAAGCDSEQNGPRGYDYSNRGDADFKKSFELLENSLCFRIGKVGFNSVTPPEEIALCRIMKEGKPSAVLESLYSKGTPAGKLYALLGLRFTNGARYKKLAPQLRQNNDKVITQAGHIISELTVKDIVELIEAGNYDSYIKSGMRAY